MRKTGRDGAFRPEEDIQITLVRYGDVSSYLYHNATHSLRVYLESIRDELNFFPKIREISQSIPPDLSRESAEESFYKDMEKLPGKMVLGFTNEAIKDKFSDRNLFGFGSGGLGLISTRRFEEESSNPTEARERLNKEIIKIFFLSANLGHCRNQNCLIRHHTKTNDLDQDDRVCVDCQHLLNSSLNNMFSR